MFKFYRYYPTKVIKYLPVPTSPPTPLQRRGGLKPVAAKGFIKPKNFKPNNNVIFIYNSFNYSSSTHNSHLQKFPFPKPAILF